MLFHELQIDDKEIDPGTEIEEIDEMTETGMT